MIGCQTLSICVAFGGKVGTLRDYWSTMIASMGGCSDFWPLVASHSVSALYYQFTSTLRVDIIGG